MFIAAPSWFSRTKFPKSVLLTIIQVILEHSEKSFNIILKGAPYPWQGVFRRKYEPQVILEDSKKSLTSDWKGHHIIDKAFFDWSMNHYLNHNKNYNSDQNKGERQNLTRLNSIARMVFLTSSITCFKEQEISTFRNEIYNLILKLWILAMH